MAEVFLARHLGSGGFDKLVALKVLGQEFAEDPDFHRMFLQEVKVASLLNHPNIVQTIGSGELGGRPYMVMEFVEGEVLSRFAGTILKKEGTFPVPLALWIAKQVADALHYAHTFKDFSGTPLHFVHRDVTPSNIAITRDGRVKLLDFGIAKYATQAHVTKVGTIKGKLRYLAPEQTQTGPVDHRADIYALGVTLWQLLTGKKRFQESNEAQIITRIVNDDMSPPSACGASCNSELDRIVLRAVERDPARRFQTAQEFAHELDAYLKAHAPGYDAPEIIRNLNGRFFHARWERIREILSNPDRAIEVGDGDSLPPMQTSPLKGFLSASTSRSSLLGDEGTSEHFGEETARSTQDKKRLVLLLIGASILVVGLGVGFGTWVGDSNETSTEPATNELEGALSTQTEVASSFGTLDVQTTPAGASVVLDGKPFAARTPVVLPQISRDISHELKLTLKGHVPIHETIEFGEKEKVTISRQFDPATGMLRVRCDGQACNVRVDGRDIGQTPIDGYEIPSSHPVQVELRQDDRLVHEQRLVGRPGHESQISFGAPKLYKPRKRRRPKQSEPPTGTARLPSSNEKPNEADDAKGSDGSDSDFDSNPYLRSSK